MPIKLEILPHDESIHHPKRKVCILYKNDKSPVDDFIEGMQESNQKKFFARIDRFHSHGDISNTNHCAPVKGCLNLYELKLWGHRIFFFLDGELIVLTEACIKKSNKATNISRTAINRAEQLKHQYFEEKDKRGVVIIDGD